MLNIKPTVILGSLFLICLTSLYAIAQEKAEEKKPAPYVKEGFTVVCFGDSLTGDRPYKRDAYQQHYTKYADLLEMMLDIKTGDEKTRVVNSGWAGDMTYEVASQGRPGGVKRFKKDVLDFKPDVVTILFSGNDKWRKKGDKQNNPELVDRTRENLRKMFQQSKEAGIKTLVICYFDALPNPENPGAAWHQLAEKNQVIREVAAEFEFPVLELDPAMKAAAASYPRVQLVNKNDGVHLSPRGEIVVAKAIFKKMLELGWVEETQN